MPFCVFGTVLAEEKDVVFCKEKRGLLSVSINFLRDALVELVQSVPLIVRFADE